MYDVGRMGMKSLSDGTQNSQDQFGQSAALFVVHTNLRQLLAQTIDRTSRTSDVHLFIRNPALDPAVSPQPVQIRLRLQSFKPVSRLQSFKPVSRELMSEDL